MAKIDDPDTARAILAKVNALNREIAIKCLVPVTIFALLPQTVSSKLVVLALALGALYFGKHKLDTLQP